MEQKRIFSVSEINKYIKMLFDGDELLNSISIRGEITNFKAHYTGHYYFTLKDESSTIKCVMFKGYAQFVKFKPADGMKVVINGQISAFERDGVYQIYCKAMKEDGIGDLYKAFEEEASAEEKEKIGIKVEMAEGEKCERCWMYSTTVGEDKENPTICHRCSQVIKE